MKNNPYTYDHLALKTGDFAHHRKEQLELEVKIAGAQAVLDSLLRNKAEVDERVAKAKRDLNSIIADLEK